MDENTSNEKSFHEQLDDFIAQHKITFNTRFVPFSVSRHADDKQPSLNWKIDIKNDKVNFTTDYMKGIGHLGFNWLTGFGPKVISIDQDRATKEAMHKAVEEGKMTNIEIGTKGEVKTFGVAKKEFPTPALAEVLQCLVSDASARHHNTYEEWANEFGYDEDSRKGEKIYNECCKTASQLIKLVGSSTELDRLGELLWEVENEDANNYKSKIKP